MYKFHQPNPFLAKSLSGFSPERESAMKELLVSTIPEKQQEVLRTARHIAESGPVTLRGIAEADGQTDDQNISRIRKIIVVLKSKMMWPYNDDGKEGFSHLNFRMVYDEPSGEPNVDTTKNVEEELESEIPEDITTPSPGPFRSVFCDPSKAAEQVFVEELIACFFELPERSQQRLWPGVANLIGKVIEPHHD